MVNRRHYWLKISMRAVLFLLFFLGMTWGERDNLFAMVTIENDGVLIYFPEDEASIAARLNQTLPDILEYLQQKGLPVQRPLHIVVDEHLDEPNVQVRIIPHLEIRIPLRAPGVLEDGYTEANPWTYFMFKGLCLQGIYGLRSGFPAVLSKGFGAIISPNVILPPWIEGGICDLLYSLYANQSIQDPMESALFLSTPPPDLDIISNHPQIWPGYFGYRIYGKPFVHYLYKEYGWSAILHFLQVHGRGLIPIEIDLKAREVFGKTFPKLWQDFQRPYGEPRLSPQGILAAGFWGEPFVYWNRAGIFPGKLKIRNRGRYGVVDSDGMLWLSEFENSARIYGYAGGRVVFSDREHVWDPGPGGVAVSRVGRKPCLLVLSNGQIGSYRNIDRSAPTELTTINAPPGMIALSGPVRNENGAIAVAANTNGNWDIWIYDHDWMQITLTPSIELDPWWEGDALVFASNATGRFQIHTADHMPITKVERMALLPRQGKFLNLFANGWRIDKYTIQGSSYKVSFPSPRLTAQPEPETQQLETQSYSPFKSIWPNYIRPDVFADISDLQIGLATQSHDVLGDYRLDAAVRYTFDKDYLALRFGAKAKSLGVQATRYPVSYMTDIDQVVDESRYEARLFWRPFEQINLERQNLLRSSEGLAGFEGLELSMNWRTWDPLNTRDLDQLDESESDEAWLGIGLAKPVEMFKFWGSFECFTENRQSLTLGSRMLYGERTLTSLHLLYGQSWGDILEWGHTTFRVGGNVSEGYFTRLPPKLFPVRGFDSNIMEAPKAAAGGIEVFWPLANLQMGYATVPLYFHRVRLGTFVDAGIAGERYNADDWLVGAGFEFLISAEIAWGSFSSFRFGVAWPLLYPDYVQDDGVKFVLQLGRPL